jgi:hypothetical protein
VPEVEEREREVVEREREVVEREREVEEREREGVLAGKAMPKRPAPPMRVPQT